MDTFLAFLIWKMLPLDIGMLYSRLGSSLQKDIEGHGRFCQYLYFNISKNHGCHLLPSSEDSVGLMSSRKDGAMTEKGFNTRMTYFPGHVLSKSFRCFIADQAAFFIILFYIFFVFRIP